MSDESYSIKTCPLCGQDMSVYDKDGDPIKLVYYKCENGRCQASRWQLILDSLKFVLISKKRFKNGPG